MSSSPFQRRLHDPAPILADGAMGTMLHGRGIPMEAAFDQLNLTHPEIIKAIHRDYLEAGAELLETNTFGANRYKLAEHGLEDQLVEIIHAGVRLAQEAIAEFQADLGGRGKPRPYALTDSVGEGLAPPGNPAPPLRSP
jgi:methionine synthase I (cobalamin-dependent)